MPTELAEFIPHREETPHRYCRGCQALLSSGNTTNTCWQCDPAWGRYNILWAQDFGHALAELMQP